jgi:(p)ppGpp synthase/HD superfamily hydrolase
LTSTSTTALAHAIALAARAHEAQQDRSGQPYILHPLRILMSLQTDDERTVAALHDVVEDTDWTLDALRREGFAEHIVHAVDCLTKRDGEPYTALIERAASDPIARRVKLADLTDNMNILRLSAFTDDDAERLHKYHAAWLRLQNVP